ncbi:MAG: type II secretion system protein [Verrucomicrobiota bacterium]
MKNVPIGSARWQATSGPKLALRMTRHAFTLIELLVVISIMAIMASLTIAVIHGVSIYKYRSVARGELDQIGTAIEAYKAKYGAYPPSNGNPSGTYAAPLTNSLYPQLYYELCGVTNNGSFYIGLDSITAIQNAGGSSSDVQKAFGVGGFGNCSKGNGDEAIVAENFLKELKQARIATVNDNGVMITNLVTSVGGPDARYQPLGVPNVNPIRYLCPGLNNPQTYDLWVQLVISGKTNLICNWSTAVLINNGAP